MVFVHNDPNFYVRIKFKTSLYFLTGSLNTLNMKSVLKQWKWIKDQNEDLTIPSLCNTIPPKLERSPCIQRCKDSDNISIEFGLFAEDS